MDLSFGRTEQWRVRARALSTGPSRAELAAVLIGALLLAGYMAFVLRSGLIDLADFRKLYVHYLEGVAALFISLAVVGLIVLLWRERPRGGKARSPIAVIGEWIGDRWRRDWFASLLWPPLLFATLMASFNAFKQMILATAGFHYDPLFARMDRMLFAGKDGWAFLHGLFGSAEVTRWIDFGYHSWFVPLSLGVLLCAFGGLGSFRLRTQYLLSYMLVWILLGSVFAFLAPSAGPCFYTRFVGPSQSFAALMETLHREDALLAVQGTGVSALGYMNHLASVFGGQTLTVGGGISAMPSVHNGLAVLFALAAFRIDRRLGLLMAGYALMIWVGSVYLGWHYAIDGIAAALCVFLIWGVSGWLAGRLERLG